MKKISRIEYCAGFEPLQSGMEQDEGSRILLFAIGFIGCLIGVKKNKTK